MQVNTPRDRAGTFEPQLVGKRQTRLAGLDDKVLDLYAGGMSVRDIEGHLETHYEENAAADITQIAVPTLLIHGEDDAIVPVALGRAVADAIPGAEIVVLPDTATSRR